MHAVRYRACEAHTQSDLIDRDGVTELAARGYPGAGDSLRPSSGFLVKRNVRISSTLFHCHKEKVFT